MHDFRGKLSDPRVAPMVEDYLRRARARRAGVDTTPPADSQSPAFGPLSINLDLTMACDYRCGHCIDGDLLNTGLKFEFRELENTLRVLAGKGLRSVILIGGGEPTLHPDFERAVSLIKSLGLQCAIASNGAHNDGIAAAVHRLEQGDWVRLSLDAGTEKTFQALHRPRKAVTLENICRTAASLKERRPQLQLGFSFVVMWAGAEQVSSPIMSNAGEMALAAGLAKAHGFDYISFKPMLVRNEERAEIVNVGRLPDNSRPLVPAPVVEQIRVGLRQAEAMGGVSFRVVPSKNLVAMLQESGFERCRRQPGECHMQHFRQVLTPSGIFACPAHRGNQRSRICDRTAYCTIDGFEGAFAKTQAQIRRFNAAEECREVTCIYNDTNWWIEELIESGEDLTPGVAADLFL
jgi:organic radical activating enzyme